MNMSPSLFTEKQIREAIEFGKDQSDGQLILDPIKLPTDDEIDVERWNRSILPYDWGAFVEGVKWACDHIKQQINQQP